MAALMDEKSEGKAIRIQIQGGREDTPRTVHQILEVSLNFAQFLSNQPSNLSHLNLWTISPSSIPSNIPHEPILTLQPIDLTRLLQPLALILSVQHVPSPPVGVLLYICHPTVLLILSH